MSEKQVLETLDKNSIALSNLVIPEPTIYCFGPFREENEIEKLRIYTIVGHVIDIEDPGHILYQYLLEKRNARPPTPELLAKYQPLTNISIVG